MTDDLDPQTSGNPADDYIIGVRVRDTETEENYDSETQTIIVGAEEAASSNEDEDDDDDGTGAILGAATKLPATGANAFGFGSLLGFGYSGLIVGIFCRVLLDTRSLV